LTKLHTGSLLHSKLRSFRATLLSRYNLTNVKLAV